MSSIFKLEGSDDKTNWHTGGSVNNVATGSREWQTFDGFTATGKYVKLTITRTYSGYQPWLCEISFTGYPACGDHFDNDSGRIKYPVTGSNYPDNADCSWVIESSGASIELKFTSFTTESGEDFLYIRDGESSSSRQLGKYSGTNLPSSVRTTTNKAFIHFISDRSVTKTGFDLTWNDT
ncbi:unnamed protein product, partial [Meganyctiphanes norvegica]